MDTEALIQRYAAEVELLRTSLTRYLETYGGFEVTPELREQIKECLRTYLQEIGTVDRLKYNVNVTSCGIDMICVDISGPFLTPTNPKEEENK